jgi:hypothetical protein
MVVETIIKEERCSVFGVQETKLCLLFEIPETRNPNSESPPQ